MTLETANKILRDRDNRAEMTGVEEALLTLVLDLQVRVAQLSMPPKGVEGESDGAG